MATEHRQPVCVCVCVCIWLHSCTSVHTYVLYTQVCVLVKENERCVLSPAVRPCHVLQPVCSAQ